MPKVAIIDGCSIYLQDESRAKHKQAHCHIYGPGWVAVVNLTNLALLEGDLPRNKRKLLMTFLKNKQGDLLERYADMQAGIHPRWIEG